MTFFHRLLVDRKDKYFLLFSLYKNRIECVGMECIKQKPNSCNLIFGPIFRPKNDFLPHYKIFQNNLIVFLWAFNVFFQIALENCSSTRWPLKTLQLSPIRSLVVTNWLFGPLRHLALHLLLPLFVFLLPI